MKVLVTGGSGYIGSHTVVELLEAGHEVLILDNLCNSCAEVVRRIVTITGRTPRFVEGDIRDSQLLHRLLNSFQPDAVVHFAGLKAVGESVSDPLRYYDNNAYGTLVLLQAMQACGIRSLVFSSSATVYGEPRFLPLTEAHPLSTVNPYGSSKLMVENMLRDLSASDDSWRLAILRYFNPVGAHPSGLIGEAPNGIPNNLMPFIAQVAVGRREKLQVFGGDYPTPDGTGIRDYIHVVDLAQGHVKALDYLSANRGVLTVNLGTGIGYSVLEMIRAFEIASGHRIAYDIVPRRAGDLASYYADASEALRCLGWQATLGLDAMCSDTWHWQQQNPRGYA